MSNEVGHEVGSKQEINIQDGQGLRELFPGFFPPSERERKSAYKQGVVSLDANALLDLYRFTPHARQEYLGVLEAMSNRIFVTHQAALEFQRNRLNVINNRIKRAGLDERQQIGKNPNRGERRYSDSR
jgi:hypothetical protein